MPSAIVAIQRLALGFGTVGIIGYIGKKTMDWTVPTNEEMMDEIPGAEARIERQRSDNEEVYEMLIRSANSDKPAWQPDYKGTREESRQGNHKG
eukprot:m.455878 g.455878  ORF g.455878 m.455878 type:complete len:94 (+) comp20950_c0_seq1:110-391(+)